MPRQLNVVRRQRNRKFVNQFMLYYFTKYKTTRYIVKKEKDAAKNCFSFESPRMINDFVKVPSSFTKENGNKQCHIRICRANNRNTDDGMYS